MRSMDFLPRSRALLFRPVAPAGMVGTGPGLTGAAKATPVRVWYVAAGRTRPRKMWNLPPNSLWMEAALELSF